eukprot:9775197-Alexandrium_andersonii.AAC.1
MVPGGPSVDSGLHFDWGSARDSARGLGVVWAADRTTGGTLLPVVTASSTTTRLARYSHLRTL